MKTTIKSSTEQMAAMPPGLSSAPPPPPTPPEQRGTGVFIPRTALDLIHRNPRQNCKRASKKASQPPKESSASASPKTPAENSSLSRDTGHGAGFPAETGKWQAAFANEEVQQGDAQLCQSTATAPSAQSQNSSLAAGSSLGHQEDMLQTLSKIELILKQMGPEAAAAVAAVAAEVAGPAAAKTFSSSAPRGAAASTVPISVFSEGANGPASPLGMIPESLHILGSSVDEDLFASQMSSSCPSQSSLNSQLSSMFLSSSPCSPPGLSSSCAASDLRWLSSQTQIHNQLTYSSDPIPMMAPLMPSAYSNSNPSTPMAWSEGLRFAAGAGGALMTAPAGCSPPALSFYEDPINTADLGWSQDPVLFTSEGSFSNMSLGMVTAAPATPYEGLDMSVDPGMAGMHGLMALLGDGGMSVLGSSPQCPASSLRQGG